MARRFLLGTASAVGIGGMYWATKEDTTVGWVVEHNTLAKWSGDKVICMKKPSGLLSFRWNEKMTEGRWTWTVLVEGKTECGLHDITYTREYQFKVQKNDDKTWRGIEVPNTFSCGSSYTRTLHDIGNKITFTIDFDSGTVTIIDALTGSVVAKSSIDKNTALYPVIRMQQSGDTVRMISRPSIC